MTSRSTPSSCCESRSCCRIAGPSSPSRSPRRTASFCAAPFAGGQPDRRRERLSSLDRFSQCQCPHSCIAQRLVGIRRAVSEIGMSRLAVVAKAQTSARCSHAACE